MKMMFSTLQMIPLSIFFLAFFSLHANATNLSLPETISSTINQTLFEVHESYTNIKKAALKRNAQNADMLTKRALSDCFDLLQLTNTQLNTSISELQSNPNDVEKVQDVQALMSAASTNQFTCLDGLGQSNQSRGIVDDRLKESLVNISNQISDALALVARLPRAENSSSSSSSLEEYVYPMSEDGYPEWMEEEDRRIVSGLDRKPVVYDLVVAQDGSGNYKTINEAVNAAPNGSSKRFVIYIEQGIYFENVEVNTKKKNIMFVGDGMRKTWIKGNRNVVDGWTTYKSAVLAVEGEGFIARDIAIQNYAGPAKHQAVALRTNADRATFFRCSIIGYQDTLYVHSLRQFFRKCDIFGTIDFVFGNSAVVLQKCNFFARKPLALQKNVFTAQGRQYPSETTGISIMDSKFDAASDFVADKRTTQSFLGRPWRPYSRTVIIKCFIGDLIHPLGWLEFNGKVGLNTLYYGEYLNRGPRANTAGRVKWPGYKVITDQKEAEQFTAGMFIHGIGWLLKTNVPFYLGLPPNLYHDENKI